MGQIQTTISLVLIALFGVAIVGFAINFASDNNAPVSILDDSEMSGIYDDGEDSLKDFREDSEDTYESIIEKSFLYIDKLKDQDMKLEAKIVALEARIKTLEDAL